MDRTAHRGIDPALERSRMSAVLVEIRKKECDPTRKAQKSASVRPPKIEASLTKWQKEFAGFLRLWFLSNYEGRHPGRNFYHPGELSDVGELTPKA